MRILHCIDTCAVAGTERHVAELATHQAQTHDVTVLLGRYTHDRFTGEDIARRLGNGVSTIRAGAEGFGLSLASLSRRSPFDVIHTHLGRASFRARLCAPGHTPLVATLHNRFVMRAYGRHDGLICIADWQRALIPSSHRDRATVIGNWTLAESPPAVRRAQVRQAFNIPDDCFLIGAAGRLVPEKCFDLLIAAFEAANLPKARLIVFGAGPEEAHLKAIAGKNVIFGGYRSDLPADMGALDGFVLPSRREPFGLVVLEAMAAQLPICATAAGGVLDIFKDHPDCLVAPENQEALTTGLQRLVTQQPKAWPMAGWRLPAQALAVEGFYRSVCAMRRARAASAAPAFLPAPSRNPAIAAMAGMGDEEA